MGSDEDLDDALLEARPDEPVALDLARARIANALFGDLAPGFGRFRILDQLGRGGMGVVYAAYDPQLDRGVALKMIDIGEGDHAAALGEAKALAKLTHPNVVPVYDVGTEAGRVYIVMELVRGKTLREWCVDRPVPHVLDAYRQAGAGLAAAHAAGLIHRDVKPDNLLVGADDGRVRVVDFGLACEARSATGRAGTPRYMAPEQTSDSLTPAVDQYAFCVSLEEALGDAMPRWVAAIVARGRAVEAADRYPSMQALLRELARDPARIARRRLIAVGGVALVGTIVALAVTRGPADDACTGSDAALAAAWPAEARAASVGKLRGFGTYGVELARRYDAELSEHARQWAHGFRAACVDHRRGVQSAAMFDRRTVCLQRDLAAYAQVGRIIDGASATQLAEVALAVAALPSPDACSDVIALAAGGDPPSSVAAAQLPEVREAIERARVLVAAGRFVEARTTIDPAIERARAIGYRPVLAEALLVAGHARMSTEDRAGAVSLLDEAVRESLAVDARAIAIEAWARRAWLDSTSDSDRRKTALDGLALVEAIAAGAPTARFARALLQNNLGGVALANGDRARAREHFARANEARERVAGPGRMELLFGSSSALLAAEDPVLLDEDQRSIVEELAARLGSQHPLVLQARHLRATASMLSLRAALVELESVCVAYDAIGDEQRGACWAEVGDLYAELHDFPAATRALERSAQTVLAIEYPEVSGYRALFAGDPETARREFEAALATLRDDGSWFGDYARGRVVLGLGRAHVALGNTRTAIASLTDATRLLDLVVKSAPAVAVQRRQARAHAELARETGTPDSTAKAWFARAGVTAALP